jgi:hypothetical protein
MQLAVKNCGAGTQHNAPFTLPQPVSSIVRCPSPERTRAARSRTRVGGQAGVNRALLRNARAPSPSLRPALDVARRTARMPKASPITQSEQRPKEYVKGLATTRPDGVASYGICNRGHKGAGSSVA